MKRLTVRLSVAVLILLVAIGSVGCWLVRNPSQNAPSGIISRSAEEDNIAQAVFLYQFQQWKGSKIYFLSRGNSDPSDEFMKRFEGQQPRVKKKSQSSSNSYRSVFDKETGEATGILSVNQIKWVSDSEVEVSGGIYNGEVEGYAYRVLREGNQWFIKSSKMVMIS